MQYRRSYYMNGLYTRQQLFIRKDIQYPLIATGNHPKTIPTTVNAQHLFQVRVFAIATVCLPTCKKVQ